MPAVLEHHPALSPPPAAPPAPACPVQRLLLGSPRAELRRVTVVVTAREIALHGKLRTYHLKQLAIEHVRPAANGRRLVLSRLVVTG